MGLLDQIDSDISTVFLNTDDFAQAAVWTAGGGSPVDVNIIFDDEYIGTNLGTGEIDTAAPQCRAKTDDLPGVTQGDLLATGGVNYYIKSVQPDGTGMLLLTLSTKGLNNG